MAHTTALILAAGSGVRAGGDVPKQYLPVAGKPVLRWAVEALVGHRSIDAVRVVIGRGQNALYRLAVGDLALGDPVEGGAERARSVRNGLAALTGDWVLIHDAARPFCPGAVVDRLLDQLSSAAGAVPVLPVADSLVRGGEPVERAGLERVQTPQAFHLSAIRAAHDAWQGGEASDDAQVARAAGIEVVSVAGDPMLDKLTWPADFARAERLMSASLTVRVGTGFDVHRFGGLGPLIVGGLAIAHPVGALGHSDADVALHALTDALLGAAGEGDIGTHFPPSDPRWKGAASHRFLEHAAALVRARGGVIDHLDVTLICEAPKIGPHRSAMRQTIADIAGLPIGRVSVKATTTEGLGFTGRGEGIAAQAVASIRLGDL